jgi:hypothetical protein
VVSDNDKVGVFAAQKISRRTEGVSLTTLEMTERRAVETSVKKSSVSRADSPFVKGAWCGFAANKVKIVCCAKDFSATLEMTR